MNIQDVGYQTALQDFNEARARASMQEVISRLTGTSNELLSYNEVAQKLKLKVGNERGIQEIPLNAIVGSVGRYTDFTNTFLPRRDDDREHWANIKAALDNPNGNVLPPVDVYKVGEVYFVLDGHERVSVARQEGFTYIQAHVIEVKAELSVGPDIHLDDIIIQLEYNSFLEQTDIAHLRPETNLLVTVPGQYKKLAEHIQVHRYFMGLDFHRDISYPEAVSHWYDAVYLPLTEPIRERGLLRWFPGRTEADLYLWVSEHRSLLERHLGSPISFEAAVADLAIVENPNAAGAPDPVLAPKAKGFNRYIDHLFSDILVPLDGTSQGWLALEQAALIARREQASLHGLHVVDINTDIEAPETAQVEAHFNQYCQQANLSEYLKDALAIVKGNIADQVCQRALLTDLIVMGVHQSDAALTSNLRSIIWRSARPMLIIPCRRVSPMEHVLLAFDGSLKSREALFVAAYLVQRWKISLTVLTISEGGQVAVSAPDYAQAYLTHHKIPADFIALDGSLDLFLDVIKERAIDLILMGGYSGTALKEITIGNALDFLLHHADCPLLICR